MTAKSIMSANSPICSRKDGLRSRSGYASWHPGGAKPSWSADAVTRPSTQDGHYDSEHRHQSLESGVMRKYHAPFGGRPTEKGSIKRTSPAAHPTQCPSVDGGPLAPASESEVDSSPRE